MNWSLSNPNIWGGIVEILAYYNQKIFFETFECSDQELVQELQAHFENMFTSNYRLRERKKLLGEILVGSPGDESLKIKYGLDSYDKNK